MTATFARSRPIKIGLFTNSFPPVVDGVSTALAEQHAELLRQGVESHVFTFGYCNYHDDLPNVWRTPGIPLGVSFKPRFGVSKFRVNTALNAESLRIIRTLDVIHLHDPFSICDIGYRLAKRFRIPLVYTNHTRHDLYLQTYSLLSRPVLELYMHKQVERIVRASMVTTGPAHDILDWVRQLTNDMPEKFVTVNNPVNLSKFDNPASVITREMLGIDVTQTVFMYVGRLTPEKNLLTLASAFMNAVRDGAQAHWVVIGDGPVLEDLQIMTADISDRVHFLGQIPRSDLPGYLPLADVFATASLSEGNPLSVTEALACGKPYVGLVANWWKEYPDYHHAGLLAENDAELSAAIRTLSESAALRVEMGHCAKRVSQHFDSRQIVAEWVRLYQRVMEQGFRHRPPNWQQWVVRVWEP